MKPGNTTTLKQLQDSITKNGFTMKDCSTTIAGTIVVANGKTQLQVAGSNELLTLLPAPQTSSDAASLKGNFVLVEGTIPESPKGKVPDSIRYQSIKEQQK
jgi:hypothetical protein